MDKSAFREILASNLPFTIFTASGERYDVGHPDFVSLAPDSGTSVIVYGENGIGFSLLDLSTITDIKLNSVGASS
ncbi:MAG: hypothetical protein ACI8T1_000390 [Verrucomicrobiales bacterium]|jgi:hypothetical protein